jgi:ABC-2 type transport system permease protein
VTAVATPAPARAVIAEDGLTAAYVTELRKLLAQLTTRMLALVAVAGPFAFAAVLKIQSGTPSDAVFGSFVHDSGFAISLVILGFAGSWGFPVIAGLIAGDIFAGEDRHGTWKTILTRSATREQLFAGKLFAAGTLVIAISMLLGLASVIAGVVFTGAHGLVDLSGQLISPGRALALTLVSWLYCVIPVLAYTAVAVVFSVATRNGILGVFGPLLVALVTQLLELIGNGVIVHMLLIGSAFENYFGLFVTHPFLGPMLVSIAVCLVWTGVSLAISWRVLRRRDFLARGEQGRTGWVTPIRAVAVTVAIVVVLAVGAGLGPAAVTAYRVSAAMGPEFNSLTLYQQALIGRHAPASARLDVLPNCNRRGGADIGPGDWNCNIYVYLPQPKSVPFQQTSVEYDVSVAADGCYKAQSPPAFLGGPTMAALDGHTVTNPLFIAYGCFNIL